MNNSFSSTSPNSLSSISNRDTFGIVDSKTGKLYSDILDYWIEVHFITDIKILPNSTINSHIPQAPFLLHCDNKLKRELREKVVAKVIVSFQKRTTGNFAFARKFFK